MSEIDHFLLNGLKQNDLIIFNILCSAQGKINLSGYQIGMIAGVHHQTAYNALKRLETYKLIKRYRQKRGQRYAYQISEG